MRVVRTPDDRFDTLPDYPFAPHYVAVPATATGGGGDPPASVEPPDEERPAEHLRLHYLDEGPADAPPVLLLHGQPTWSYLYRHVVRALVEAGHRVVVPDLVGFGRSDKPVDPRSYSFAAHLHWLRAFVALTGLRRITLVAMDWGGPLGLSALAAEPDRFERVVVSNTVLHTGDPALAGRLCWSNHGTDDGRVVLQEALVDYVLLSQRAPAFDASVLVRFATAHPPSEAVLAAYDAPFPDERFKAGVRQFPVLIPLTRNDPGAAIGRATWAALRQWHGPFLTAYGDADPATGGWDRVFQAEVPGARGLRHTTIAGAAHFLPEDHGDELATTILAFMGGRLGPARR